VDILLKLATRFPGPPLGAYSASGPHDSIHPNV
jgi:hypothetical protein